MSDLTLIDTDQLTDARIWIGAQVARLDAEIRAIEQRPRQDDAIAELAALNRLQALRRASEEGAELHWDLHGEEDGVYARLVNAVGQEQVDDLLKQAEAKLPKPAATSPAAT